MGRGRAISVLIILLFAFLSNSCGKRADEASLNLTQDDHFVQTLEKHLRAISDKDIEALKSTLTPDAVFFLILPGSETSTRKSDFIEDHLDWFQDTTWTYEYNIVHTEIGKEIGLAIVDIMYREPSRNDKPYFNHMTISYGLKLINNTWYVFADHASSIDNTKS